jgi:glycosyltransferase involved in cell wall biosynthesis
LSLQPALVSTVIPVFNREDMLREAVASVLAQTHRPLEIILVDDGSTDETAAVCDELAAQHPGVIRALHQPNTGPGAAREAGRRAARGGFIQYLDSDDLLAPQKFEIQVEALNTNTGADVAVCAVRQYDVGRPSSAKSSTWSGGRLFHALPALLNGRVWLTPAFLVRREASERAGAWIGLRQYEDWEYDVRLATLGSLVVWCPEILADVRHHALPRAGAWLRLTPEQLRDRARAHVLIYHHARSAGIGLEEPEMRRFARALFYYARQCGAAGFSEDSRELFGLAREASGCSRSQGLDFRLYRALASTVGWRSAGALSSLMDRLRT